MNNYYIESRYADEVNILANELTAEETGTLLDQTKEIHAWLKIRIQS